MFAPFRHYADFSGRSGRREFWLFTLFLWAVYLAAFLFVVAIAVVDDDLSDVAVGVMLVVCLLFWLATIVPGVALSVRRLHDIGQPGWLMALLALAIAFFSIFGWIAYMIVMSLPGKREENRWGPPLGSEAVAEVFA